MRDRFDANEGRVQIICKNFFCCRVALFCMLASASAGTCVYVTVSLLIKFDEEALESSTLLLFLVASSTAIRCRISTSVGIVQSVPMNDISNATYIDQCK